MSLIAVLGVAKHQFTEDARARLRQELERKIYALAEPYLNKKDCPQHVLAKRIDKHLGELFTFVQYPGSPSGNNAAERAIRPAVIARKVSGGTRSEKGSETRTKLMSLFGTWQLQGKDLLRACTDMLVSSQSVISHV
ncbi:MAG: transposase [Armatimonadetes bacterium]|nr:transposase [Armatimonadota bacterium]